MPSEIAQTIVNHIFSDEKAKAIDAKILSNKLSGLKWITIQYEKDPQNERLLLLDDYLSNFLKLQ